MKRFYFKIWVNGEILNINYMAKTKQEATLKILNTYKDVDKFEFVKFE